MCIRNMDKCQIRTHDMTLSTAMHSIINGNNMYSPPTCDLRLVISRN